MTFHVSKRLYCNVGMNHSPDDLCSGVSWPLFSSLCALHSQESIGQPPFMEHFHLISIIVVTIQGTVAPTEPSQQTYTPHTMSLLYSALHSPGHTAWFWSCSGGYLPCVPGTLLTPHDGVLLSVVPHRLLLGSQVNMVTSGGVSVQT